MTFAFRASALLALLATASAADFTPAPQRFIQEVPQAFTEKDGLPARGVQLIDTAAGGATRVFIDGRWYELRARHWQENPSLAPRDSAEFTFADASGQPVRISLPWAEVTQLVRFGATNVLATPKDPFRVVAGRLSPLGWPSRYRVNQIAVSSGGTIFLASDAGLFREVERGWQRVEITDDVGRAWAAKDVLGVALDSQDRLWFATKAGVGCQAGQAWRFYEGKDGLPWNDFAGITAGQGGEMWFATHLGAIRFDGREWQYRQGPLWLPHDDVTQIAVDAAGRALFATAAGLGVIERTPMTLAAKAELYEREIQQFIKRTPYGYVAEAHLRRAGDKSSADPQDSDNDGLWTAMYGAGECFAYAATKDPRAHERARQAFEALRFLQEVTQGGEHSPPPGYIARTIRPVEWPDPNAGRLEQDKQAVKRDRLWKIYEPRWPKSADGKWFWKSDTSSDELDGHYFFYPLYFDFCAESEQEKDRVRDVVRGITDHLLEHRFVLIDHDGRPTRWAIFGPQFLNKDPLWWPERGLNSLSILSYLAVATHVTGDAKYAAAARELIEQHGYAHNLMYSKVQHGPGSGNQSDDEMAFMCYYNLLRFGPDDPYRNMVRYSFFNYWVNEAPEMNPFFNFAYAAHGLDATGSSPWGRFSLKPWPGWHEDAMATLRGMPLDRRNWAHRNSHRLDLAGLARVRSSDVESPDRERRGHRVNGKVLPVENRHFNHWNTDPWELDYGGSGNELASGTVFLLPYYLGLYHGFIEKPVGAER